MNSKNNNLHIIYASQTYFASQMSIFLKSSNKLEFVDRFGGWLTASRLDEDESSGAPILINKLTPNLNCYMQLQPRYS